MPENILVVEYEPRYTDRVKQALAGQAIVPSFAKDGEEALRVLESQQPRLIVLSSVVPKVSTPELIRAIRGRKPLSDTPILVTVSGYNGKSPKQDAVRMGASDILPKPYSESEFLGKVQQMLGVRPDSTGKTWAPELDPEFTARPVTAAGGDGGGFTSNEIFGELLEDDNRAASSGAKKVTKPKDDLDKMLADTLAGVMPQKKKDTATLSGNVPLPAIPAKPASAPPPQPPPAPAPAAQPPAQSAKRPSSSDLDKMLNDTLSGLNPRPKTQAGNVPVPAPQAPAAPRPAPPAPAVPPPQAAAPKYQTARMPAIQPQEKVVAAQPVFAAAAPAPAPPTEEEEPKDGTKFGQYVLLEKIATGGMAEVWKARMRGVEGFQKIVAIKKILPHLSDNQDFIEMFIDEAKLAAQLNHNNIIHIYDLGKIQSSYYIAMEYIDGHDLKTILKRGEERDQPLTVEIALFVASKIAAALDYAHRKHDFEGKEMGLVHRDVSPQNVLISQEGDIKLCDFGIAKAASKASHTQAGALKGKLQYMSPEQAWGRSIDKRSDIFALATVLFEMLTGRKLFTGDNELSILEQVREARVTLPSEFNEEVTPEIDKIVVKALQKDPANRYQTAGEMERDINAILYTFRPTPTSADLAIFMHRLLTSAPVVRDEHDFGGDPFATVTPHSMPAPPAAPAIVAAPPLVAPAPSPAPAIATPTFGIDETPKKAPIVPIAVGVAALLAIVIGVVMMNKKSAAPATPVPAVTKPATTTAPQTASTGTISPTTTAPTSTAPALDQSKVNEEVQKRLAAERARLEQQQKTQPAAAAAAPTQVARNTPPPIAAAPQPQPQTPAPVTQPVERPVVPAPAPQPVPQPTAPAPAQEVRAREGDTVAAGTEGLTPPRMTHQAPVSYPPMAKMQHIEGVVIMSVSVNETGQVMEVRVIKGDPRLNAAAEQSVRRSSFSAATKDGVHVKSSVPVSINFKL